MMEKEISLKMAKEALKNAPTERKSELELRVKSWKNQ